MSAQVMNIMSRAKAKPRPRTIPYPKAWLKGASNITVLGILALVKLVHVYREALDAMACGH